MTALDDARAALRAASVRVTKRTSYGYLEESMVSIDDAMKVFTTSVGEGSAGPGTTATSPTEPTDAEVEAAAQALTGLTDRLWAIAKEDGTEHLTYYYDMARVALEAARAAS